VTTQVNTARWNKLDASDNPFAVAVMTHLALRILIRKNHYEKTEKQQPC